MSCEKHYVTLRLDYIFMRFTPAFLKEKKRIEMFWSSLLSLDLTASCLKHSQCVASVSQRQPEGVTPWSEIIADGTMTGLCLLGWRRNGEQQEMIRNFDIKSRRNVRRQLNGFFGNFWWINVLSFLSSYHIASWMENGALPVCLV